MKKLLAMLALVLLPPAVFAEQHYEPLIPKLAQTADFTITTTNSQLGGWSVHETAGSTARIVIRDASDTDTGTGGVQCNASGGSTQVGGNALVYINLAANETAGDNYSFGLAIPRGACVDVTSGSVDFTAYLLR